jgi:hypothetical protein
MKLGNISQTIVPVPKFYTDKNTRTVDIFKSNNKFRKNALIKRSNSYFRSKDLFSINCDLNINNNPRTFNHEWEGSDELKYVPIYDRGIFPNNANRKNTYFPNIIDTFKVKKKDDPSNKNEFNNVKKFLKNTDLNNFLKKDLRQEILDNTKNLIDRINVTYDMSQWNGFDCRTTMNLIHQPAYSPIYDVIRRTNSYKEDYLKIIDEKSLGLKTISDKTKKSLEKRIRKKQLDNKNKTVYSLWRNNSDLNILLNRNKTNLLELRKNNKVPLEYSKEDQKFVEENKSITKKINNCELYKHFPSKTRMEFEIKKLSPLRKKFSFDDEWGCIDINNYKSKKENFHCLGPMWIRPLHVDAYKIRK